MNNDSQEPPRAATPLQVATVKKLLAGGFMGWKPVDPCASLANVRTVNLRHLKTKLSRLNLTKAAREAAALKAQFRHEDEELYRQGRGDEVLADRKKNLGITGSGETRLLTVNGVRIDS